jgi:hypothetical protein
VAVPGKKKIPFVEKIKASLGFRAKGRKIVRADDNFELREGLSPYNKSNNPDFRNTFSWEETPQYLTA